jgi:hypothetical protein
MEVHLPRMQLRQGTTSSTAAVATHLRSSSMGQHLVRMTLSRRTAEQQRLLEAAGRQALLRLTHRQHKLGTLRLAAAAGTTPRPTLQDTRQQMQQAVAPATHLTPPNPTQQHQQHQHPTRLSKHTRGRRPTRRLHTLSSSCSTKGRPFLARLLARGCCTRAAAASSRCPPGPAMM